MPRIDDGITGGTTSGVSAGMDPSEMKLPRRCGDGPVTVELTAGVQYAYCTCGLSDIQPFCNGAHRGTGLKPIKFTADRVEQVPFCLCKQSRALPRCDGSHAAWSPDD